MMALPYYNNTTLINSTGSGSCEGTEWYVDDRTGSPYIRVHVPCVGYGTTNVPIDHTYAISKEVTKKDLKAMKDEIRKYMKDQMLEDAKEVAGQLFDDIEKLKEEKTQLKKSVTEIKKQVKKVQADVKSELQDIEDLIERRTKEIIKFSNMDFSRS